MDTLLKPPEYKRNSLGQFDRPGKTMRNAQKSNKQVGEIVEAAEVKIRPGRPKGSKNKVTVALKEAILQAGMNVGGEKGLVGYLERLAVENSSAYAGLLAKILPHQLAVDAQSHGGTRTEIRFTRVIVHPGGREEIEGESPKLIEHKASPGLPQEDVVDVEAKDINELWGKTLCSAGRAMPVANDDEVTEEKARQIDELLRAEFETDDWVLDATRTQHRK